MSRSGYSDECDNEWALIRWRGAVASAICGRRGQALLKEMANALDAMEDKSLIANEFGADGAYCALGVVGKSRGIAMDGLDPLDRAAVALTFGIAPALAAEIMYVNDEVGWGLTPQQRFHYVRRWIQEHITES